MADVQKCTMNVLKGPAAGWIAPEIYLITDEGTGKLAVSDGVIAHFNKEKPVEAKIGTDKPVSLSFEWNVQMVNSQGQRTKMQYIGSLFKASREFHVQARPIGFSNSFSAVGSCAPYNG